MQLEHLEVLGSSTLEALLGEFWAMNFEHIPVPYDEKDILNPRWWNRRMCIFSCENSKTANQCWTNTDRRMLDPTKKRCPMTKDKGEAPEDGRRGEIAFRMKSHTCQRCSEGSNKAFCTPLLIGPTETKPELLLSVRVSPAEAWISSDLHGDSGSYCSRPGSPVSPPVGLSFQGVSVF